MKQNAIWENKNLIILKNRLRIPKKFKVKKIDSSLIVDKGAFNKKTITSFCIYLLMFYKYIKDVCYIITNNNKSRQGNINRQNYSYKTSFYVVLKCRLLYWTYNSLVVFIQKISETFILRINREKCQYSLFTTRGKHKT